MQLPGRQYKQERAFSSKSPLSAQKNEKYLVDEEKSRIFASEINFIIMCTINMTFEVPESKSIDIEALKKQINDLFNVIVARPSVLKKEKNHAWTEEFRGKWQDTNISAEDFVREIREHRETRSIVDL